MFSNQLRQRALRAATAAKQQPKNAVLCYSRDLAPRNFFNQSLDDAFSRMEREFNNFERFFSPMRSAGAARTSNTPAPFSAANNFVAMDVKETPTDIEVHVEVPGIAKENLKLEFHEKSRVLSISGEFKYNREDKEGTTYHTVERRTGSFTRSLTIPDNVNAAQIKAEYKDGILTVNLPKVKEEPPKKVDIKIE